MTTQSEQILENNLIAQLQQLGHEYVTIKDEKDLLANLKGQLEKHNKIQLSAAEFQRILNHLNKGNIFDRAQTLRDKFDLQLDNGDTKYIEFLDSEHWCQNQFQVTRQVSMTGSYANRYDVTLLINGLPLVQIELKRRGLEMKEAFNQVLRYHKHSFAAGYGLFQYVQIFIISNGVNTKYYVNDSKQEFKQTFWWTDRDNNRIAALTEFAQVFLEPCHISKMICKYIVLNEQKHLMVLRPYQFYAVEAIIDRVKNSVSNGYIWHTTGSGKTLTSFKASQIITKLPQVYKVVFVVDRKDLDYQTAKEFNSFVEGSVDSTDQTKTLVQQFTDTYKDKKGQAKNTPLIVTTIQKLNNAIGSPKHKAQMEALRDKRIIFIFDECHRSQFGDTHKRITEFFTNKQMFGFTGTPIFADNAAKNALGLRTTKDLFDECLHKYVITDAIRDENVLKFSVEYVGKYREKEGSKTDIDIEVEDIDRKELIESPERLNKIVDYIIANHERKTHSRAFTGMFCVSSVDTLIKYYDLFKAKKEAGQHNLKIATIFSYAANEDERKDSDTNGFIDDELDSDNTGKVNQHSRDKLEEYIADYNKLFNSKYTTKDSESFYNYYKDIGKKVKEKKIDILLVVNMFLTGFDSKPLNTLYVDKNLKYHGLIQAYSRTNRILDEVKSQGNIVCFRNLKDATDKAIALFANKDAKEVIFMHPFEDYVAQFNKALEELKAIVPTVSDVKDLQTEDDELEFVQAFRELMRLKNVLSCFSDFSFDSVAMSEQEFNDYKSAYLDLWQKVKVDTGKEKVSILNDVDFELELLHRDEINVAYILALLAKLKDTTGEEYEQQRTAIMNMLGGEAQLRSKKELIERFIAENLPQIEDSEDVKAAFDTYWSEEQKKAFDTLLNDERLKREQMETLISNYLYEGREPLRDDLFAAREAGQPSITERKTVYKRVFQRVKDFVETFINGMGE